MSDNSMVPQKEEPRSRRETHISNLRMYQAHKGLIHDMMGLPCERSLHVLTLTTELQSLEAQGTVPTETQ